MEFSEVLRRRRMYRAFTAEPLPEGTAERLLRAAERAPSAGFSQGYSFLVLSGKDEAAPLWQVFYDNANAPGTPADEVEQLDALVHAPLVIVPLACKDIYLEQYSEGAGWTDKDEARWPVPYWYVDTGFAALLMLLAVVDAELGAVFFGIPPTHMDAFRAAFGVPDGWTPIGAIAVGYPDPANDPVPPARRSERKPLADLVHNGRW